MKTAINCALVLGCSAVLGALIWILSLQLTGNDEPWDNLYYYGSALFVAGFVPAYFSVKRCWLVPVGSLLGQMAVLLPKVYFQAEPLMGPSTWPLGLIILFICLLMSVVGAVLGAVTRLVIRRFSTRPPKIT